MAGREVGREVVGTTGESFLLTDYIGHGAFGEVYRARSSTTGSIVAVKILSTLAFDDEESLRTLENEATLAVQIDHPNVVRVYQARRDPEIGPFIVMEYVPDGTLQTYLSRQRSANEPIALDRAILMMLEIAQGAKAINDRLVHRDIKPDNILLSGDRLKIGDFGISKLVEARTRTWSFKGLGPITHMAPEAWELGANTLKLDVYAVGLVFIEILTLQHPLATAIHGPNLLEAWRSAHLLAPIPDVRSVRSDTPLALSQLLSRMAAKRAPDRPAWDETIRVLSSSASDDAQTPVRAVVERAVARHAENEAKRLSAERSAREAKTAEQLYAASFAQLVARFDGIVDEFNRHFQHGSVKKSEHSKTRLVYALPSAKSLSVECFGRRSTGHRISGLELLGGAVMSLDGGVSANLLLLKESADDLYGRWIGCLINISALVDPRKSLNRLRSQPKTVPFGFQSADDFYEHMAYAGGGIHIFTYEMRDDPEALFRDVLDTAYV